MGQGEGVGFRCRSRPDQGSCRNHTCQVGQFSALLTRRAQLHDSLGNLRVHGVLGYGSKHALWLWSAPSPTFEQMMHGPSSAPEAVRRVRHGGWRRREAVGGLAPASSGSWLVL